jgi:hypothetical protein
MDYEDRVLIPAALPWHSDFLEMRRFGTSPNDLTSALIFRLFELQIPSIASLFPRDAQLAHIKQLQGLMNSAHPSKEEVVILTKSLGETLERQYQCSGIELIAAISQASRVTISLFNHRKRREESLNSDVDLAWTDTGTLFILYGSFTFDSFIDLPCGHFDVKYKFYKQIQQSVQSLAVSSEQIANISLVSDCCDNDVSAVIVNELFPAPNSTEMHRNPHNCYHCGGIFSQKRSICVNHKTCIKCGLKAYFTEKYQETPCCSQKFDTELVYCLHEMAKSQYHLTPYFAKLKHQRRNEEAILSDTLAELELPPEKQPIAPPINILEKRYKSVKASKSLQNEAKSAAESRGQARRVEIDETGQVGTDFCRTCERRYEVKDAGYQCQNACQCRDCSIENALIGAKQPCSICRQEYSQDARSRMSARCVRCHVCHITRSLVHIAANFPCGVCLRCVELVQTGSISFGRCSKCRKKSYTISKKEMSSLNMELNAACCRLANTEIMLAGRFSCGHAVCKVHVNTLRVCRKCKQLRIPTR